MRTGLRAWASAVALILTWQSGAAQGATASMSAAAVVVTGPISVTPLRDLTFGTVLRGMTAAIAPTAANAGAWSVTGSPDAAVRISFTLPTLLINIQAAPGSTMPIAFGNTAARWRRANNDPNGAAAFNPAVGVNGQLGPPANPTLYVWLGGQVDPAGNAKPGIYTGLVVVTLVYL